MQQRSPCLLDVRELKTWFGDAAHPVRAVDGVSFSLAEGGALALVGESGCGKSVTALSLTRLLAAPPARYAGGRVLFEGTDLLRLPERRLSALRGGRIAYVFQEPATALNPVMRVGAQIAEALRQHRPEAAAAADVHRLMDSVGLPDPARRARSYPHELSGGMQQRVMIAMALAGRPALLIADEPTTALDVTIQAQILDLLRELRRRLNTALLLITHNLALLPGIVDDVAVMYAGRIVEAGPVRAVLGAPRHPYTRGLLDAVPRARGARAGESLRGIPGRVPDPGRLPPGCAFAPRCARARARCRQQAPEADGASRDRLVRCFFPLEST
jgi:oligopeptide/dipeptide ABC transporter ATP-binding protein